MVYFLNKYTLWKDSAIVLESGQTEWDEKVSASK